MSHLIAAIDESLRPNTYLMCATVASTADRVHIAHSLRALLLPNQRRLHAHSESRGRKRSLIKAVAAIEGLSCSVLIGHQRGERDREECLGELVKLLLTMPANEIVLERVDPGTAARDTEVMSRLVAKTNVEWRHEVPDKEPLLWVSDLVVNAHCVGGDLRALVAPIVTRVVVLD